MPYGRKKNYHGRGRHFTNPDELAASEEREKREKAWKKKQGIEDSDNEEEEGQEKQDSKPRSFGAPGDLPPSDSEEETDSEEEDEREHRPKGVSHLIETANPNHVQQKSKKISSLDTEAAGGSKADLTRKQKDDLEKQQAHERYMKAHLAGKTEEARSDMARLAIIRKQREDAARKKEAEKMAQDAKKTEAENKLLEKKKQDRNK